MAIWDSIIGAAGKLIGGFMDSDTADENRAAQLAMAERNIAAQKEYAQQGIRWKVEDAKAAGIHPLYGIGASATSFSPVSIGNLPEGNMASTLGGMGQDIGRAINAGRTDSERDDAFSTSVKRLQLEGAQLDNDIKRASLASSVQRLKQQSNPPLPGELSVKKPEDVTQIYKDGPLSVDKGISDAQEWENRYGEAADWLVGPYIMWRDYMKHYGANSNVRRMNLWDHMKKYGIPRPSRSSGW